MINFLKKVRDIIADTCRWLWDMYKSFIEFLTTLRKDIDE